MEKDKNSVPFTEVTDVPEIVQEFNNDYGLLSTIFNSIPMMVFLINDEALIIGANNTAIKALDTKTEQVYRRRGGDLFRCVNSGVDEGCGYAKRCNDCPVRNAVLACLGGEDIFRKQITLTIYDSSNTEKEMFYLLTTRRIEYAGKNYVIMMIEDIDELIQLKKLIPICSSCKKIRDDEDYWKSVEEYFTRETEVMFTHSLCPECLVKLFPELYS